MLYKMRKSQLDQLFFNGTLIWTIHKVFFEFLLSNKVLDIESLDACQLLATVKNHEAIDIMTSLS